MCRTTPIKQEQEVKFIHSEGFKSTCPQSQSHLQKFQPRKKVRDVAAQGFEAGIGALGPFLWDPAHYQTTGHCLQLCVHHHQTLDGFHQVLQTDTDQTTQPEE